MDLLQALRDTLSSAPAPLLFGAWVGALVVAIGACFTRWRTWGIVAALAIGASGQMLVRVARPGGDVLPDDAVLSLLADRHPELRRDFDQLQRDLERRDAPQAEREAAWRRFGAEHLQAYMLRYVASASDDSIVDFTRALHAFTSDKVERGDEACFYWLAGQEPPPGSGVSMRFSPREMEPMSRATRAVVKSALEDPQPRPEAAEIDRLVSEFVTGFQERHGPEPLERLALLGERLPAGTTRLDMCRAFQVFYGDALATPEPKRPALLRALYANATES